jgi:hypothetical protein
MLNICDAPATVKVGEAHPTAGGADVPNGSNDGLPGPGQRLRCGACGNLTRFDVVARRRTAAYWHYSLAGELSVEGERDLEVEPELIRCRWCGSERDVEVVAAPGARAAGSTP